MSPVWTCFSKESPEGKGMAEQARDYPRFSALWGLPVLTPLSSLPGSEAEEAQRYLGCLGCLEPLQPDLRSGCQLPRAPLLLPEVGVVGGGQGRPLVLTGESELGVPR